MDAANPSQPPRANRVPALVNFGLFQAGWFAAILGAAEGIWWAGPAGAVVLAGVHLWGTHPAARRQESALLVVATCLGLCLDAVTARSLGVMEFQTPDPALLGVPVWMASLWLGFATVFNNSLRWIRGRYRLAMVCGALGGPLAYLAGERLGALASLRTDWVGLAILAVEWSLAMVMLLALQARLTTVQHPPPT